MLRHYLDFERPLMELEREYEELKRFSLPDDPNAKKRLEELERKLQKALREIYSNLTPWQRTQLSRHIDRPHALDFIGAIFEDFIELHGDRRFGDDPAIVAGFGKLEGKTCVVIGQQKGSNIYELKARNFGMPHPEGYRKALRVMQLGARFKKPIITFVDTPGAYPGVGAEERGQAEAIATNLLEMSLLPVPIVSIIIGEGGSGGALAICVADRLLMLENATFSVISPEGCAAILWRTRDKAPEAASQLKLTAQDLKELGIIDEIIPEPLGGAHRNWQLAISSVKEAILRHLGELLELKEEELLERRYQKYRKMGGFLEGHRN
jgi:acetyl-CoA carboxylase carboxyl transferase subunit alpha